MSVFRKVKNNKGQGLIEYILLLVVIVAIIMGFSSRIYKPLGNYVKNYVGEYLQCLLETGELPVINDGSGIETECSELFKAGNQFAEGNLAGKNGNSSDSASGKDKSKSSKGGDSADSSSGGSKSKFLNNRNGSGGGGLGEGSKGAGNANEEKKYTGSTTAGGRRISSRVASGGRVIRSIPITGFGYAARLKQKEKEKSRSIGAIESQETEGKVKKMLLKKPQAKIKEKEMSDDDFSFGKIFRFFIIAIILILILIVVGGEASSVLKSMD